MGISQVPAKLLSKVVLIKLAVLERPELCVYDSTACVYIIHKVVIHIYKVGYQSVGAKEAIVSEYAGRERSGSDIL